ncbi:MAG: autotransporter outer membrane beta-barrel domain-containing protein [Alphaproteobacteria bacterium]|nr:autotransporter outer membrane beta-barrel domain-containing protein [Alphaproteobacteria bacterium]
MKRLYFSFSLFAFFSVIYSADVFAASNSSMQTKTSKVDLTPLFPDYSSSNDMDAGDDYGILIDQLDSAFNVNITNAGNITANDVGYGIWGTTYPTRGGKVLIVNNGSIKNIQLKEFTGTNIISKKGTDGDTSPVLSGNILLGTESNIANYDGTVNADLVSFAYKGHFNNGVETIYSVDPETGTVKLTDVVLHESTLQGDTIQFGTDGLLSNGHLVNIDNVKFGENGSIVNVGENYEWLEDVDGDGVEDGGNKAGQVMDTFSKFNAENIVMGSNGKISNEMGTTFDAGTIQMGTGASIVNGADYALKYDAFLTLTSKEKVTTTVTDEDGNETTSVEESSSTEDYQLNEVPHGSSFHADKIVLGDNSTILNRKGSSFTGHDITFGENGKFDIQSGAVELSSDENDTTASSLTFGSGSSLYVSSEFQEEVTEPQLSYSVDTDENAGTETEKWTVVDEVILPEGVYLGELVVDNIKMGNNSSIDIVGGIVETGLVQMGDGANIFMDLEEFVFKDSIEPMRIWAQLNASEGIYLGNSSSLKVINGFIDAPIVNFLDDGKFTTASSFSINKLNMGQRAEVTVAGVLKSDVTLGSNSNVYVTNPVPLDDLEDLKYYYEGGGIQGSLKKAPGAENVHVTVSSSDDRFYTLLKGQIDVDSILLDQGLLELEGNIKGHISLNTDTILRLTGRDLYIHDPVTRLEGSSNTTVEVAMLDQVLYQTTNWMSAENLLLSNGGISINNAVNFDNVIMGDNTTVRLTGNYKVGNIRETNGDAVNTTLEIAAGFGNSINSSGSMHMDRILISSGNFNVFHDIYSLTKSGPITIPVSPIDGIELGSNATMTTFANVSVNQVLRNQELIDDFKEVANTTLTVNADHFQVLRNVDIDNLNMNGGVFEFMNKDGTNAVNITNDIKLKPYSALAGAGILNIRTGHLALHENARLAVSMQDIETQPISELHVLSSDTIITDSTLPYQTKELTVETDSSGYIDVRASGDKNDKIIVDGTVNLADGTRILVRDIQSNQEYEILSAFQLNGNSDKLRTTFLWTGVEKKIENNTLSLSVKGVQTLKEGIKIANHSKNVDELADTLTKIRQSEGAYSIDPFLDSVFFAESADEAVRVLDEYSPEGYLNTMQASLRMQKVFKESVMGEMNAMRNYRIKHQTTRYYVKNPYYYGRPGHEKYYYGFKEGRRNPYQERRSDRGGIWAKPFMMSLTQDDKDNQSGYDLNAYGFTAGIDRKVGVFTLGLAALYASGDMEQNNKNMQSDLTTYGLGVYGSITPHYSRSFMDFYALWSQTSVESKRKISSLSESTKADFDMTAFTLGADIGYEILVAPNFILTPKIGLDYTSIEMDDVAESGNGRARVLLKGTDLTSIQMPVEVKAAFDFGSHNYRFRPEFHARWTHEFGDTAAKSTANFVRYAAPFAVEGLNVDKDVFTVGGSLLWLYGMSEFELKYDYDFSSSSTGHSINMGYKYLF